MKKVNKQPRAIRPVKFVDVQAWSPGAPEAGLPCTQVHITYEQPDEPGVVYALRFKSREALQSLIDGLIEHRDYVWPSKDKQL